jgi:ATP-dependent Clp protease protease subunit
MAIYDTLQFVSCDVATLCVGHAASSSAILLAAGVADEPAVPPHACVRLHQSHTEVSRGSMSDLAIEAAELERVRTAAEALLVHHTGRSGPNRPPPFRAILRSR